MTPFDPVAVLAMLLAFYPVPSGAALHRARAERPEYFAGGTIIGRHSDALRLPDGRIWDLIFAVEGPFPPRRWQAIDVTDAVPGPPDPFPLEDGPLVPLDEEFTLPPFSGQTFEALVAGELEALGASDDVLHRAAEAAADAPTAAWLEDAYARLVAPAEEAHKATRDALEADDIVDELEAAAAHERVITTTSGEYDDPPPPDLPEVDPGDPPGDKDAGGPPPPEA